jgi:hypothetical protein
MRIQTSVPPFLVAACVISISMTPGYGGSARLAGACISGGVKNESPLLASAREMTKPLRFVGLCVMYTAALVLVITALRAAQKQTGHFQINFEYRVF